MRKDSGNNDPAQTVDKVSFSPDRIRLTMFAQLKRRSHAANGSKLPAAEGSTPAPQIIIGLMLFVNKQSRNNDPAIQIIDELFTVKSMLTHCLGTYYLPNGR